MWKIPTSAMHFVQRFHSLSVATLTGLTDDPGSVLTSGNSYSKLVSGEIGVNVMSAEDGAR